MATVPVPVVSPAPSAANTPDVWQSLRTEMDRLFDNFTSRFGAMPFLPPRFAAPLSVPQPAVDITEKPDAFMVTAEIPGMAEKDIEVLLSGDTLMIKGEKRQQREEKGDNQYSFRTQLRRIPARFHPARGSGSREIAASFSNGVLSVTLPKTMAAAPEEDRSQGRRLIIPPRDGGHDPALPLPRTRRPQMVGITLSPEQIQQAPPEVRPLDRAADRQCPRPVPPRARRRSTGTPSGRLRPRPGPRHSVADQQHAAGHRRVLRTGPSAGRHHPAGPACPAGGRHPAALSPAVPRPGGRLSRGDRRGVAPRNGHTGRRVDGARPVRPLRRGRSNRPQHPGAVAAHGDAARAGSPCRTDHCRAERRCSTVVSVITLRNLGARFGNRTATISRPGVNPPPAQR